MLLGSPQRSSDRRLALAVRSAAGEAVLAALLRLWGYRIESAKNDQVLLLAETGLFLSRRSGPVLRLVPVGDRRADALTVPLTIGELWLTLEERFHHPHRRHIRLPLDLPVVVEVRHRLERTRLCSLSDRGGRFGFPRALPVEETVRLCLPGEEEPLAGKVIYSIDRSDIGGAGFDIGVMFEGIAPPLRRRLHERIVEAYLQRIRKVLPEEVFLEGVKIFRLFPPPPALVSGPFPGERSA